MKNYTISVNDDCKIKIKVNGFKCLRCGHRWIPRVELEQLEKDIKNFQEYARIVKQHIGMITKRTEKIKRIKNNGTLKNQK